MANINNFFAHLKRFFSKSEGKEQNMTEFVWNTAINLTLGFEGGYVNDRKDRGGETKYGVSKKAYPDLDIKNLTIEEAKKIYKKDYWDRCKCQFIPDALSIALFDFAVNSGTKRAIKHLQKALGVTEDGIIGNQTIGACNRLPVRQTFNKFIDSRLEFLMGLKDWQRYGNGWGKRVSTIKEICEKYL